MCESHSLHSHRALSISGHSQARQCDYASSSLRYTSPVVPFRRNSLFPPFKYGSPFPPSRSSDAARSFRPIALDALDSTIPLSHLLSSLLYNATTQRS